MLLAALAALLAVPSGTADARTLPRRGAVRKPTALKIRAPFPCGVAVKVTCGYGPRCSGSHRRTAARMATNDHYALDLARRERGNGAGKAVVAVAAGVVKYAGWARGGWAPYGKVVYIEHTGADARGRRFQSMYAHLGRVKVRRGQRVAAGTVIGTLGGSSRGRRRVFGAHLHFALYRGAGRRSRFGGGRAVVPEPLGAQEDLRSGVVFEACSTRGSRVFASREAVEPRRRAAGGLTR